MSLCTTFNDAPAFYQACFDAFAGMPWRILLSTGGRAMTLPAAPPNVEVQTFVPQLQVLRRAQAFITHGGMNSANEGLLHGVPMVVVPQRGDQHLVAARIAELGAGLAVAPHDATPTRLRESVARVLTDASFRDRARGAHARRPPRHRPPRLRDAPLSRTEARNAPPHRRGAARARAGLPGRAHGPPQSPAVRRCPRAAIASPPRAGAAHAVLLLDLNGFKQVNDVHGHAIGDELLIIVAQRLLSAMRQGDLVARFGGDEFAVLALHLAGAEAATNIALRILQGLEQPIATGSVSHQIGAGIGIALLPADADSMSEAMRKADVALYRAKAERRSALRFFEPDMDRHVHERAVMERELREAIAADRIQPCY